MEQHFLEASYVQVCAVCRRQGIPNTEPGWYQLDFFPVMRTEPPRGDGPVMRLQGRAVCPEHTTNLAAAISALQAEAGEA